MDSILAGRGTRSAMVLFMLIFGASAPSTAQEVESGTLAAAIRAAGHPCAQVIEKERQGESRWLVRCNSGRFEVRLKGDAPAEVVPVEQ